jgi:hypothetical protein
MEISGTSPAFGLTSQPEGNASKKTQEAAAQIEAVPKSQGSGSSHLPEHLGQNVNTTA